MNTSCKALVCTLAAIGVCSASVAVAQKTSGGVVGIDRLHPSTAWSSNSNWIERGNNGRYYGRGNNNYYNGGDGVNNGYVVRSDRQPYVVAQAAGDERRFSYEPSQSGEYSSSSNSCGCPCGGASNQVSTSTQGSSSEVQPPAAPQAPAERDRSADRRAADGSRRFSYEPTADDAQNVEAVNGGTVIGTERTNSSYQNSSVRTQRSGTTQRERYVLPKTDPNKYRVN